MVKRRPDLPPRMRGRLARRLTAAPRRWRVSSCRSARIAALVDLSLAGDLPDTVCPTASIWREVSAPSGKLLTHTVIRHSTDAYFQAHRPIPMGTVQLDAGPVVFARLSPDCTQTGSRVRLFNTLDRGGEQVFVAMPEDATVEPNIIADPNREIAGQAPCWSPAPMAGIGRALVEAFVKAGAARVWATTRKQVTAGAADAVVQPVQMDVTEPSSVASGGDGDRWRGRDPGQQRRRHRDQRPAGRRQHRRRAPGDGGQLPRHAECHPRLRAGDEGARAGCHRQYPDGARPCQPAVDGHLIARARPRRCR